MPVPVRRHEPVVPVRPPVVPAVAVPVPVMIIIPTAIHPGMLGVADVGIRVPDDHVPAVPHIQPDMRRQLAHPHPAAMLLVEVVTRADMQIHGHVRVEVIVVVGEDRPVLVVRRTVVRRIFALVHRGAAGQAGQERTEG
jgi:hypothetical protein